MDDPYLFGAIAAANALSDIYAMGGRPLTALSIAAFPEKDFPPEWAAAIVRGGFDKLGEAGCTLLGGHTIRDPEVKFGYAVTGIVDEGHLLTNAGAQPGDVLVLTKALGTGVVATALKAGRAPEGAVLEAGRTMALLNALAGASALKHGAHAATDITGFGLAGHAAAIARESAVTLEFDAGALPFLPGAEALVATFQPAGLAANRRRFEPEVADRGAVTQAARALFYDPQTSGGLLLVLPPAGVAEVLDDLPEARRVGRVLSRAKHPLALG